MVCGFGLISLGMQRKWKGGLRGDMEEREGIRSGGNLG